MRIPYTYLVGWSDHKTYYYGVQFREGCSPDNLWVKYFTSSEYVKAFREKNGEPDIIQIRKIFKTKKEAVDWEHKVLRRMKVVEREDFLNRHTGDGKFYCFKHSEETKLLMKQPKPWFQKPVMMDGMMFPSRKEASEWFGVSKAVISIWLKRGTLSFPPRIPVILTEKSKEIRSKACLKAGEANKKPLIINGNYYSSIRAAGKSLGIPAETISWWIHYNKIPERYDIQWASKVVSKVVSNG